MKKIIFLIAVCLSFISCVSEEDRKAQDTIDEYIWNLVGKNYDFNSEFATKIGEITTYDEYLAKQKEVENNNIKEFEKAVSENREYEEIVSNLYSLTRNYNTETLLMLRSLQIAENVALDILGSTAGVIEKENFTKIHIYNCTWEYNDAHFFNKFYLTEDLTDVVMVEY